MSLLGYELNRSYVQSIAGAALATDWVAVELYSSPGNPIYLDGLVWGVDPTATADIAITAVGVVEVLRNLRATPGITFPVLLGPENFERIYRNSFNKALSGENDSFDEPIKLEPGYIYLVIVYFPVTSAVPANPVEITVTARGRTMPDQRVEPMPRELRTGSPEEGTENCVTVNVRAA